MLFWYLFDDLRFLSPLLATRPKLSFFRAWIIPLASGTTSGSFLCNCSKVCRFLDFSDLLWNNEISSRLHHGLSRSSWGYLLFELLYILFMGFIGLKLHTWLSKVDFLEHHDIIFNLLGLFSSSNLVVKGMIVLYRGRLLHSKSF